MTGRASSPGRSRFRLRAVLLGVGLCAPALAVLPPGGHAEACAHERASPRARTDHPAPRAGVSAARVLPAGRFQGRAARAYAAAHAAPHVLDGIRCHCDCHHRDGLRSLLSCFESDMAATCGLCQGQALLARRLHAEGKTLDQIRAAVDFEFGY